MLQLLATKPTPWPTPLPPQTIEFMYARAENALAVDEKRPSEKKIALRSNAPRPSLPNAAK